MKGSEKMTREKLITEIEKLKKYTIFKSNRCKLDNLFKEEESLTEEWQHEKQKYLESTEKNAPLKKELTEMQETLSTYENSRIKKPLHFFKYTKLNREYKELKKQVENIESVEQEEKRKVDQLEKKRDLKVEERNSLCGFSFTKEEYITFLEEFREKAYYNTNLNERINRLEQELQKQAEE